MEHSGHFMMIHLFFTSPYTVMKVENSTHVVLSVECTHVVKVRDWDSK